MKGFLNSIIDLFFPKTCPGCGRVISSDNFLCKDCSKELTFIRPPLCPICGIPLEFGESHICGKCLIKPPFFKAARSCALYQGPLSKSISLFKYEGVTALARPLSLIMIRALSPFIEKANVDLILPVPLHIKRLRQRGFNQALLLARQLGKGLGIPVNGSILKKVKETPPQVGLSQKKRLKNVKGSFKVFSKKEIEDKNILLVDDVFTTGTTVNECSKVLVRAGARGVFVITLARTYEGKR